MGLKRGRTSSYWIYHEKIKIQQYEETILMFEFFKEFWDFLKVRKKYWLLPILNCSCSYLVL